MLILFIIFFVETAVQDQEAEENDDSDMYMEPLQEQSNRAQSQTFVPSFAPFHNPPLGHSRPYFYQQEAAYSHRPTAYQQHVGYDTANRFSGYKGNTINAHSSGSEGILGSGNFGVLRGGTFYNDNDGASSNYADYNPFYQNGHGRPQYYFGGNPPPQQHEQFANFRDFADINTPSSPAYSQFVVVYANKNNTIKESDNKPKIIRPKNIIEHLAMLDMESETTTTTELTPTKKLSKSKRKLAKLLPEKKLRNKKNEKQQTLSTDLYEPLLALSWI